ncbi:AAA ATPase central domain protein [Desulfurispirillum indicum S5]|uniref:Replication-associated recombination protein A n=1 Tax=Desulfurispirillum indicum (strain ATCC BAA-1389 / DSM 22839 / S5) TaxID=653733 RepID=E6W0H2_DESIS|nr:replication-associated recombination protein A [Desulfurispirillum indicum]ADU65224.1 AAA ATPase central domain protein [Desulfurispirillum indicum S5]
MNSSLFDNTPRPLAARLRPTDFADFVGQRHLLGERSLLRRMVEEDKLVSAIFTGPPGTGKTTLAHIISQRTQSHFATLNAVNAGTADIRAICKDAKELRLHQGQRTVLFIDEIHRFNKIQQDALLPEVESGNIILIGASTQNPSFALVPALLSRTVLFELHALDDEDMGRLVERGCAELGVTMDDEAREAIMTLCSGDGRRCLNTIEAAALLCQGNHITRQDIQDSTPRKIVRYDKNEDNHYDYISAFIKSVRGSDPDSALYYLAVMLEAGEDPLFIARRLAILASEDIGNAAPGAINMAASTMTIVERIGMPEARITLAQTTVYLCLSPKSNAAYLAIDKALASVRRERVLEVPDHLKNLKLRAGKASYQYPHDFGGFVRQNYMTEKRTFYEPTENGYEAKMKQFYQALWGEDGPNTGT